MTVMKHLLFVDDESKLLDGLKRSLRTMRHEWNMAFVTSGEEALKQLQQMPFDVVVSDMRMPGMDGAQLLNEVRQRYPHVVRIILSGHSDRQMIFESISATHQFLAKPCETEQLMTTIQRACALRQLLKDDALSAVVAGIETIPSFPTLFSEIKTEAESESSSLKTIGDIIAKDMGMTAKVLQLVNSAYFGLHGQVSTAEQAVTLLGLDTIQALVLTVHVFSQFSARHLSAFHLDHLWEESMEAGALARAIAKGEGQTPLEIEQAFTAGLLHDVGILVLAANIENRYSAVLAEASAKGRPVWEAEQSEFGTTHAEVGAYLLGLWGLSDSIVEAVAYHHRPGDCVAPTFSPLTAVHAAHVLRQDQGDQGVRNRLPERPAGCCAQTVPDPLLHQALLDMAYLDRLHVTERVPSWRELAMNMRKETAS